MGSAIWDLDLSIQTLEKSRTEYRAALLWMKNVSEKLQNPDYRDQLARFRAVGVHVCVCVVCDTVYMRICMSALCVCALCV